MPSTVSTPLVNLLRHSFSSAALDVDRVGMGDVPFVEVRILLLSRLILRPICLVRLSNSSQKKRLSSNGTTAVRSST